MACVSTAARGRGNSSNSQKTICDRRPQAATMRFNASLGRAARLHSGRRSECAICVDFQVAARQSLTKHKCAPEVGGLQHTKIITSHRGIHCNHRQYVRGRHHAKSMTIHHPRLMKNMVLGAHDRCCCAVRAGSTHPELPPNPRNRSVDVNSVMEAGCQQARMPNLFSLESQRPRTHPHYATRTA